MYTTSSNQFERLLAAFDLDQLFHRRFAETRIVQPVDIGMHERVLRRVADKVLVPARMDDDPHTVGDLSLIPL